MAAPDTTRRPLARALGACLAIATAAAGSLAAAPAQRDAEPFAEVVTASGMRIWSFPDDGGQRFLLMVLVGAGSRDEDPAGAGTAHFLEHVLFRSTTGAGKPELDTALREHGADVNGFTVQECTAYHIESRASDWRFALDWLAQHLVRPAFLPDDVEAERRIVHEEVDLRMPHGGAVTIDSLLYPDHALGRVIGGDKRSLRGITTADLRRFYEQHYRAGNIAVGFAGRVPRAECVAAIRTAFADLPAGDRALPAEPVRPRTGTIVLGAGDVQRTSGELSLGYHLPAAGVRELAVQLAIGAYLEDRFFDEVREVRQLSYAPEVALFHFADVHRLQFDVQVSDQRNLTTVVEVCDALIEELRSPDPARLQQARDSVRGVLRASSAEQLGRVMQLAWLLRRNGESPTALAAAAEQIGRADVAGYAEDHLTERNRFLVTDSPALGRGGGIWVGVVMLVVILVLVDGLRGFVVARSAVGRWASWRRRRQQRQRPARIIPIDATELEASIQRYLEQEDRGSDE